MFIGLYIDDFILIFHDLKYLSTRKAMFAQQFSMTDNNDIEYILGIQIRRDPTNHTFILTQDKYIFDLLEKFNMTNCKPIATPMKANIQFESLTPIETSFIASIPYVQAIGSF